MQTSLTSHQLYDDHHESALEVNSNEVKDHGQMDELENRDEYTMNCFLCQKLFTDIDELQEHLSIHYIEHSDLNTTTQYFNCNVCERNLRSEQELNDHYKRYHEAMMIRKEIAAGKRFPCKLCGNVYISFQFLLKHVDLSHCKNKESAKHVTQKPEKMYAALQCVEPKKKYPPRSPYFNP